MNAAAIQPRPAPARGRGDLPGRMARDHADHWHAVVFERDQGAEQRHVVDERLCPIDGVEDPAVATAAIGLTQFFAEDAVSRALRLEESPDSLLGPPVGYSYRRTVGL